jgi:hypothetical protein
LAAVAVAVADVQVTTMVLEEVLEQRLLLHLNT